MPTPAARLACATPQFVERAAPTELDDWLAYFDPDVVLLTGESAGPRAVSTLRRATDAALFHPASNAPASGPRTVGGVQFAFAPTTDDLRRLDEHEGAELDADTPTFVVGDRLSLDVDTTALSTTLVGREAYAGALDGLDGEYVHVSTRLPADYRREWDGLTVVGGGVESGRDGSPLVALDCRADGRVLTRSLSPSRLGLRALDGVGPTRARRLREAGFVGRGDVAEADARALADLEGVGRTAARRMRRSATAVAEGEVVRTSDEPLPSDPLYIDIETDGLNPTVTWLIGVLDGTAADGTYRSFLQRDPDDPGGAVEAFMSWYTSAASHRPLVAYHGRGFDFDVLHDHVVEHCPRYAEAWADTERFDPYHWAVEAGNAVLPGRTNKLEDVASALGYEGGETGLTGAAVARAYRAWMADPSPATELDWERFDAYCEADVRALATVYEAIEDRDRIAARTSRAGSDDTRQGSLSEWQ